MWGREQWQGDYSGKLYYKSLRLITISFPYLLLTFFHLHLQLQIQSDLCLLKQHLHRLNMQQTHMDHFLLDLTFATIYNCQSQLTLPSCEVKTIHESRVSLARSLKQGLVILENPFHPLALPLPLVFEGYLAPWNGVTRGSGWNLPLWIGTSFKKPLHH